MGKSVYVVGIIATIAVIALAVFSIKYYEDSRIANFNKELNDVYFEQELDKVYEEYLKNDPENYCYLLEESISNTAQRLYRLGRIISQYKNSVFRDEYVNAKRNYMVTNLNSLSKTQKAIQDCNFDVKPIIYFYSEDGSCGVPCDATLNMIEQLKVECEDVWVFAFTQGWEEFEFTKIIEKKYDVKQPGILIINDKKFEYPQTKEALKKELGCE
jgi:hypothetical protein